MLSVYQSATHPYPPAPINGLASDDPLTLPRPQLFDKVMQQLRPGQSLLVTAPPGSGKTCLIEMLVGQLSGDPTKRILSINSSHLLEGEKPMSSFAKLARDTLTEWGVPVPAGTKTVNKNLLNHFDYIFVDDAQRIYGSYLMTNLCKHSSKACIGLFASYDISSVETSTPHGVSRVSFYVSHHLSHISSCSSLTFSLDLHTYVDNLD